jgi:ADP-ribose pyrophosphatase YjhB (NUDIX family)
LLHYGRDVADEEDGAQGRWRTFGAREIYQTPDLWFGQVDVELPGGERVWEPVARLHQSALMALLDGEDRVLLVRRHRFVPGEWGWELPGGLVDEEEDPAVAAVRELEDTTGYRPGRVDELITFRPLTEMVDCEHVVFTGRDPERAGDPVGVTNVGRVEWVALGSIPELIGAGEIWHSGTLVGLLRLLTTGGRADSS